MIDRYIGVEQEFVSFNKRSPKNCIPFEKKYFNKLCEEDKSYYSGSDHSTSIRASTGHAFYVDGSEIEVCTPPVRINTGFATRLTDLIIIGKEKIAKATPDLINTGLSMHWNISKNTGFNNFYNGFALPFHLFGITPISRALNMRLKENCRAEFLGDYLTLEDQINALALLFGAYSYAFSSSNEILPIYLDESFVAGEKTHLFAENGRYSVVNAIIKSNTTQITAQHYLELFHQWVSPFAKKLSTKEEFENLEAFIFGDKKLEFDYFNYFAHVLGSDGKSKGRYYPLPKTNQQVPIKTLRLSGKERQLPLEGRLLGGLVNNPKNKIESMNWTSMTINGQSLGSIFDIYDYAQKIMPDLKLEPSPEVEGFDKSKDITIKPQIGPKKYDPKKDIFKEPSFNFLKMTRDNLKSLIFSKTGTILTISSLSLSLLLGSLLPPLTRKHEAQKATNSLIKKYTINYENNLTNNLININQEAETR
jgi:hypothetical protein